jgi:hypothetical protein
MARPRGRLRTAQEIAAAQSHSAYPIQHPCLRCEAVFNGLNSYLRSRSAPMKSANTAQAATVGGEGAGDTRQKSDDECSKPAVARGAAELWWPAAYISVPVGISSASKSGACFEPLSRRCRGKRLQERFYPFPRGSTSPGF